MELDNKTIAGIVTLIIILSSGGTYYIQSLGEKTGCRAGWVLETQGEFEGYYKCITSTNIRYEMCFNVFDSANTKNYWCEKGKIINIEEIEQPTGGTNIGTVWECGVGYCNQIK